MLTGPGRALSLQSSKEDAVEELIGGFNSSISLDKGKVCQAMDTIQCKTEVRPGPGVVEEKACVLSPTTLR